MAGVFFCSIEPRGDACWQIHCRVAPLARAVAVEGLQGRFLCHSGVPDWDKGARESETLEGKARFTVVLARSVFSAIWRSARWATSYDYNLYVVKTCFKP